MAKKKQAKVEFRYYDMPAEKPVLVLSGEGWKRAYGHDAPDFHFHNILEIGYCREGSGRMLYEKEERTYRGGMISVIPDQTAHNTMSDGVSYWEYVFIDAEQIMKEAYGEGTPFFHSMMEHINSRYLLLHEERCPEMGTLVGEIIREYEEQKPYHEEVIRGLACSLLLLISRENREFDKKQNHMVRAVYRQIQAVMDYIREEYAREICCADLAKTASMSETHFRRLFVQVTDMPPMDYVNMVRVQKACELLRGTEDSMEQVAAKVGYQTITTFNRNFKKFIGTSPYQWKRSEIGRGKSGRLREYKITVKRGWE